jgi:hypothetical protein
VLWDGPTYRLLIARNPSKRTDGDGLPYFVLRRYQAGTFQHAGRVGVGDAVQDASTVVGNPDSGPFAVQFDFVGVGVENFHFNVVTRDLHRLPKPYRVGCIC